MAPFGKLPSHRQRQTASVVPQSRESQRMSRHRSWIKTRFSSWKSSESEALSSDVKTYRAGHHNISNGRKSEADAIFQRTKKLAERQSAVAGPKKFDDEFTAAFLDMVDHEVKHEMSFQARLRAWLAHVILNQRFETCIGTIILINFVIIALETDTRARRDNAAPGTSERETAHDMLQVITVAHLMFLCTYTVECAVRIFVLRLEFFNHGWNIFDLSIVAIGMLLEVFSIALSSTKVDGLDGLRSIRTIRLLRATRVLVSFEELYALISGLTHAMKALIWAGILMLMVLTVWSIIAVEYVKPLMAEIHSKNGFGTCTWCPEAFDNLFLSNLTFFQIISGDGWSHVGRPLIEEHLWTVLLFVGVIFTMIFGLLNLIVAVIVDSAVQAREADIITVAARKDAARAAAWDCFNDMVDELDVDGDGEISIEELREGLLGGSELGSLGAYLTTMGIEMTDLDMVFELLDSDGDGSVSHEEFTHQLYQMKTQELPITLCYVRSHVAKLHREFSEVSEQIQEKLDNMLSRHTVQFPSTKNSLEQGLRRTDTTATTCSANGQDAPRKESGDSASEVSPGVEAPIVQFSLDALEKPVIGEKPAAGGAKKRHALTPIGLGAGSMKRGSFFVGKHPPTLRMPKAVSTPKTSTLQGNATPKESCVGNKTPPSNTSKSGKGGSLKSNGSNSGSFLELKLTPLPGFSMEEEDEEDHLH